MSAPTVALAASVASVAVAALSPAAVQAQRDGKESVVATKLDGTRRLFAGSQTELYELSGTSWTTRSSATYTGSSESRWSFCQFGDTTIASNLTDAMQSSASGAFAAIAGAPKAKIVVSASNNFVVAFNTNDATYTVTYNQVEQPTPESIVPKGSNIDESLIPESLAAWLDNYLLPGHLWVTSKTWDPEGILSTLPAIGTGLAGVFTGKLLTNDFPKNKGS